jgi:hypothetical protein
MTTNSTVLYRTATGGRLHIRECPHVFRKEVFEATDGEICTMCERELRGEGRRYFDSLADALADFDAPRANWPLIEQHLAAVEHDDVWIPCRAAYIALGKDGKVIARAGKTYVQPSVGVYVELPGFRPGHGGGVAVDEIWGELCEKHNIQRARNGSCWMCEN